MKNYSNEITALEVQIIDVKRSRFLLEQAIDLKVKGILDSYFNYFKEMEIKVSGEQATFHLKDGEGYNKEIFSLYFYSRYQMDPTLQISYYSSSTNNEFELERLILLGRTANVLKERSESILSEIKQVKESSKELSNELFGIQDSYEKKIVEYRKEEVTDRKVQIEQSLKSEGITFIKPTEIKFKFNYLIYVKSLKIVDISASGKTATAVLTFGSGHEGREKNCNMESIVDQVTSLYKNIAELEMA